MKKRILSLAALSLLYFAPANGVDQNSFSQGSVFSTYGPPPGSTVDTPPATSSEVTSPLVEEPPIPAPASSRPNGSAYNFVVDAKTKATGTKMRGNQPATLLTACGNLSFIDTNRKCSPIKVAKAFVPMMLENIPKCVNEGLIAAGYTKAAKISTKHFGTYNDRTVAGSRSRSMHSTGRAIDIYNFSGKTVGGKNFSFNMTIKQKNAPFYKTFNKCWEKLSSGRAECNGKKAGVIDCSNSKHHDHVHLSMIFCPRIRGISGE